jgi:GT2 family glycosyltransferase
MINNYFEEEKIFLKKTGVNINSGFIKDIDISKSASIVIPFFNNLKIFKKCFIALQNQYIPKNFNSKVELIIVDDGSNKKESPLDFLQKENRLFNITLIRFLKNQGRSAARNIGILHAKGKIIIFLDSDILVDKYFVFNHLIRHQFCKKVAIVGFRENIDYFDSSVGMPRLRKNILPNFDYKSDFRYKKFIPESWKKTHFSINDEEFNKNHFLLKETNFFKDFTIDNVYGVWDLPFMFLTCNASVSRREAIRAGGFDLDFKGWGLEDTYFAYKLLNNNIFIIPVVSAKSLHVVFKSEKNQKNKMQEYRRNLSLYKTKKLTYFNKNNKIQEQEWEENINRFFRGKYTLIRLNKNIS